mmetsp:Transcript_53059/g.147190  ORF Transcript_53059/g.147190 Transcript_53059/m.147190 type:complete len:218 (+) Transcript_53059:624-1277(+)
MVARDAGVGRSVVPAAAEVVVGVVDDEPGVGPRADLRGRLEHGRRQGHARGVAWVGERDHFDRRVGLERLLQPAQVREEVGRGRGPHHEVVRAHRHLDRHGVVEVEGREEDGAVAVSHQREHNVHVGLVRAARHHHLVGALVDAARLELVSERLSELRQPGVGAVRVDRALAQGGAGRGHGLVGRLPRDDALGERDRRWRDFSQERLHSYDARFGRG